MWSRKPALSWLDRLRSNKGIPITSDLNLDQFLHQNPNSSSDSDSVSIPIQSESNSNPNSILESLQESEKDKESSKWFNTMSSVLAELFVMEDKSSNKSHQVIQKKASRKQINPKICVLPSPVASVDVGDGGGGVEEVGVMSPSSVDNSVVEMNEELEDLSGCSRLDCVVIDTSSVDWKTENLVIRKGNVWKVREKNLKLKKISLMKKKRKAKTIRDDDDDDDEDDDDSEDERKKKNKSKKKKMKQKLSVVRSTSISNKDDDDQCGVLPFEGSPVDNNQISIKRTHPNLDQAPIKRCKFLSLSANAGKKSSVQHL